jgi:hypothetical protein
MVKILATAMLLVDLLPTMSLSIRNASRGRDTLHLGTKQWIAKYSQLSTELGILGQSGILLTRLLVAILFRHLQIHVS